MKIKKIPAASTYRPFPLIIKYMLAYSLVLEPDQEIVFQNKKRYNYHELNNRVRRLANVLSSWGLDGGETVAVMDYDSHRYLECYFGIPMTGNVLHCINWRLSPAQILYTINHAEDKFLILHADFLPIIEKFVGQMPSVKKIIVISEGDLPLKGQLTVDGDYEALLGAASDTYDFPDFDEDAVATTFYTTGTTGDPKGVYFSHRQLVLHTYNLAATFGFIGSAACRISSDDVYMPLTPMFHVHAWGFPYLASMFSLKQVYPGKFVPSLIAELLKKEKPTLSHCVPTILQMILACPEVAGIDLSSWKVMTGGSALPKTLARSAMERGIDVINGYGMSETCPVIAVTRIAMKDKDRETEWQIEARTRTGVPTPMVELALLTPSGSLAAHNDCETGEIVVRAPWLTKGYIKDEERGAALWKDGYLHTGDVASINKTYSLKIADRIKDVIKSGGEWISSIDLENLIGQHEAVAEAAVVSMPDARWGERPFALLVLKPGRQLQTSQLREYLQTFIDSGKISKWAMPEQVEFTESIPKTSVGKIDKKRIRAGLNRL